MRARTLKMLLLLGLTAAAWACGKGPDTGPALVVPVNATESPVVTVRQIVERDTLVGRRVRVAGVCGLTSNGPSAGVWRLRSGAWSIEVRGLVPRSCIEAPIGAEALLIFAQVVEGTDSTDRLLLRLPD